MSTNKGVLRSLLVFGASIATALFLGVSPASADNGPHQTHAIGAATSGVALDQMGADRCASCHRAHTAQSAYLLASASQEDLCYTCHGNAGAGATTNVQSGLAYGGASAPDATTGSWSSANRTAVTGALRGGGFEAAAIGTSGATKDITWNATRLSWSSTNQQIPALADSTVTTSNHLSSGPNTMWGSGAFSATANPGTVTTASTKLECGSCHDPHGNGQYRILRPVPVNSGFATITTNTNTGVANTTPGVFIKDTVNKVYTTTNYWIGGDPAATDTLTGNYLGATSYVNPVPVMKTQATKMSSYQANVAAWCTTCHTRYLAPSGSYANSTGDAVFTYRHRSDSVSRGEAGSPNCTQCHVAHGSNAVMSANSSVEWPGDTAVSSDSRLLRVDNRGVCTMCHNV